MGPAGRQCWCRVRLLVVYMIWTQALHTARSGSRARLMEAQGAGARGCGGSGGEGEERMM